MKNIDILYNIVLVSLDEKFADSLSSSLATNLDMYASSFDEMIVYDLINPKEVLEKCGFDYFKKREKKVVASCAEFRETIFSMSFDLYKEYKNLLNNSLIVFIEVPNSNLKKITNEIDYNSRNQFMMDNSDIYIKVKTKVKTKTVKMIMEKLGELL